MSESGRQQGGTRDLSAGAPSGAATSDSWLSRGGRSESRIGDSATSLGSSSSSVKRLESNLADKIAGLFRFHARPPSAAPGANQGRGDVTRDALQDTSFQASIRRKSVPVPDSAFCRREAPDHGFLTGTRHAGGTASLNHKVSSLIRHALSSSRHSSAAQAPSNPSETQNPGAHETDGAEDGKARSRGPTNHHQLPGSPGGSPGPQDGGAGLLSSGASHTTLRENLRQSQAEPRPGGGEVSQEGTGQPLSEALSEASGHGLRLACSSLEAVDVLRTSVSNRISARGGAFASASVSGCSSEGCSWSGEHWDRMHIGLPRVASTESLAAVTEDAAALPTAIADTRTLVVETLKGVTFLNQYMVLKTLGRGAFGKVKLCINTEDRLLYAVKVVSKGLPRRTPRAKAGGVSPLLGERGGTPVEACREVAVLRGLSHPNVVRLVEVIDDAHAAKLLIVLQYVEGGPVVRPNPASDSLALQPLAEPAARRFFRDVLQGVDYLHTRGIVHGDLKPDNLLLGADGRVRLVDLGSARFVGRGGDGDDVLQRTAGTPAFFSPEMAAGAPFSGRAADLWAAAVCLFHFVTGVLPWRADAMLVLYDQIRSSPPAWPAPPAPQPSLGLANLLAAMLAKDPAARPAMHTVMKHPWLAAAGAPPLASLQAVQPNSGPGRAPAAACALEVGSAGGDGGANALAALLSPLFRERCYLPGAPLAAQGEVATEIYYIEDGEVEICRARPARREEDDALDDEDEASSSSGSPSASRRGSLDPGALHAISSNEPSDAEPARPGGSDPLDALLRAPSDLGAASGGAGSSSGAGGGTGSRDGSSHGGAMRAHLGRHHSRVALERLASAAAAAVRLLPESAALSRGVGCMRGGVVSRRRAGQFVGEVSLLEGRGRRAVWATAARAAGPVKALVLQRDAVRGLLARRPDAEAPVRAAMAQRKAELLRLEALELLAGLAQSLTRALATLDRPPA